MTQKEALAILKLGHTAFLTGAAGTGKSHILKEYVSYLRRHGIRYAVTASTGIASTHIGGTTIHSWSGIGIKQKLHTYELEAFLEKEALYKRWNETKVLIIDEVSMLHASFIDLLDRVAKHMRGSDRPFGGVQVIFTGDFFQLPPVVRAHDEFESKDIFAFTSRAWQEARPVVCYLEEQFRQDDNRLSSILEAIRRGEMEEEHYELLREANRSGTEIGHIKLYTHNETVDQINKDAFDKIEGTIRAYQMITKGKANLVEALKSNCLAEELLELKVGAKVICIKNALDRSYVNGSMGIVKGFSNDGAPTVELAGGKIVTIQADSWKIEEDGKVRAELTQLPLKLAWAITVHKSQGMTLDKAEIDLSRAFTGGQGYVALSRLKSLEGLYLKGFNAQALQVDDLVREADYQFKNKSVQAEKALSKYTEKELKVLQEKFILDCGGELAEIDVADIMPAKVSSWLKTEELLKERMTLEEIAKRRKLSFDTIVGHVEKLLESNETIDIAHILPDSKDIKRIAKAFTALKTNRLTPVYEHFDGKYPYHEIRLVRASLE